MNRGRAFGNLVWMLACLALGGCGVKFLYGQADRLVMWRVGDYVDLDREQSAVLREGLDGFLEWHRTSELPRYADDVDQLVAWFADGPDHEEFFGLTERARIHQQRVLDRLAPLFADVVVMLSPEQLDQLEASMAEANAEILEEGLADADPERRRKVEREEITDLLEEFFGRLDREQRELIGAHVTGLPYETEWVAYRSAWQADLLALLRAPRDASHRARIEAMARRYEDWYTPGYRAALDRRRDNAERLLVALWPRLSLRQRDRFFDRLDGLAEDFRELAARG